MSLQYFEKFAKAVRTRFDELSQSPLYVLDVDSAALWEVYLKAFPEGTNPMFRKRTEHDCSCCRHFIRDIGAVVGIQNGAIVSVWDNCGPDLPEPYRTVTLKMADYVRQFPIRDIYYTNQAKHGVPFNHQLTEDKKNLTFHHFAVEAPKKFVVKDVATKQGDARTTQQVLLRGVRELAPEAVKTVADLISSKALYRGEEFTQVLLEFMRLQGRILSVAANWPSDVAMTPNVKTRIEAQQALLAWENIGNPFVARLRNTALGTLLQDLSAGVDLEEAVKAYEKIMAPSNYKRPTALITKGMVEAAMKTIQELELEQALERRHAKISDVSVNSVLFVDNAVQPRMKDGKSLMGLLMEEVKPVAFDAKNATEIGIEDFLKTVLPKTKSLQLYLDNNLTGNMMSLTAPVHPEENSLFKWNNDFAWSYEGNVTDSIKERVKRAGGMVENVAMRVSLAWSNTDDLDIHVREPNGNHINFTNKSNKLDVDMNVSGETREPVENVRWITTSPGMYSVSVHQFRRRESKDVGFTIEIEAEGNLTTLRYEKGIADKATVVVAKIQVAKDGRVTISPEAHMVSGAASQDVWGLKTLSLVRVNAIVLSPNHWDDNAVGNKHWFFLLEGCNNPLPTRGIYNEFLHSRLEKHRKVFEVLGDKSKCEPSKEQLSGVGFSSTQRNKVSVVAVGPNLNRPYTVIF